MFTTAKELVEFYPEFATLAGLIRTAGLLETFQKNTFDNTLFVPTNNAFKAVVQVPEGAALVDLLTYHVVLGSRSLPDNFTQGQPVATLLKGHTVSVEFGR